MLIVKATGLVPVKSVIRGGRTGVFGVTPAAARIGLRDKTIELVDIPNSVETIAVADPQPEPEVKKVDVDHDVVIEIPDDWKEREPLVRFNLAKRIAGKPPTVTDEQKAAGLKPSDVANLIIEEEIQRRAAADAPAE